MRGLRCEVYGYERTRRESSLNRLICLIAVAAVLAFAGSANALTTTTSMPTQATVTATCSLSAPNITFSGYVGTAQVTSVNSLTVQCNTGTVYTITMNNGLYYGGRWRSLSKGSGAALSYAIYTPGGGAEWGDVGYGGTYPYGGNVSAAATGVAETHTFTSYLFAVGYYAAAGYYNDTVTVTVNY